MKIQDVSLLLCKYRVDSLMISIPGYTSPYVVDPILIGNIIIEKDFDRYFFPYFEMIINVPNHIARDMRKNNQDIRARLKMSYDYFDDIDISKGRRSGGTFLNGSFFIFLDDSTPDLNEDNNISLEQAQGIHKAGMDIYNMTTMTILLYNEDYLFKTKSIVNAVITSGNLTDMLTFTLNKAGIRNVLFSPANNYKTFQEFFITPITVLEQIVRLCNDYAIHNSGSLIFFDLDRAYILNQENRCTAFAMNEIKTTYLTSFLKADSNNLMRSGCYCNNIEKYSLCNIMGNTIAIKDDTIVHNQVYGGNFLTIDKTSGSVAKTSVKNSTSKEPSRVLIRRFGGNTSGAVKQQAELSSRILSLGFQHVNIDMLTPNKEFIFTTDSAKHKKYEGKYIQTKMIAYLTKEGPYYSPSVSCEFRG